MSGGPLDDLLGPNGQVPPRLPVHARVLDLQAVEGRVRSFACWEDPGGPQALFAALRARVEGSLVGELSETAHALVEEDARAMEQGQAPDRGPAALHLAVYPTIADVDRAVRAFGLERRPAGDPALRPTLAALRHEWAELGIDAPLPEPPAATFAARVRPAAPAVDALERQLRRAGIDDVWGADPGAPFRRLAEALPRRVGEPSSNGDGATDGPLDPDDLATIDRLESALVPRDPGVVRWIPPLVFQALCDAVGVVASRALGARVDWGVSAPDEDTGLAPPPVFRITGGEGERYLPIALELLRWCVMPLAEGEAPPTLSEWLADAFS